MNKFRRKYKEIGNRRIKTIRKKDIFLHLIEIGARNFVTRYKFLSYRIRKKVIGENIIDLKLFFKTVDGLIIEVSTFM